MKPPGSYGTILVVDDKERNLEVLGTTLVALGYDIIPATTGEQAFARIAARLPDLILLDILMPGVNGFEVCRRLKDDPRTAGIPIIFVSAAEEKNVIVRALEAGGVDYVTKPFNKAELTARVRTHLELKHARDELHRLADQREEMMGVLAHDLKSPLFGVRLSSQMLVKQAHRLPENLADLAAAVQKGMDRVFESIDNFLSRAAADRTDLRVRITETNLAESVEGVIANYLEHAQRKEITLEWEKPAGEAIVKTDPSVFSDALDNLVSNAIKFSFTGSKVQVSLDAESHTVIVRDEGPGFTEEDKQKLFQRFVRLSAEPTGGETSTGLGLSIAKKCIDLLGGSLTCVSEAGKGTEFRIQLTRTSG